MPTSVDIKNLKINKLTEAQYDTAVQGGVIGENELSVLTDLSDTIQVETMPTASASNEGQIVQYVGATDSTHTNAYFYKCVSDGQNPATYSWEAVEVQASSGSSLPDQTGNAGKFLTTDGTDASWSNKPLVNTSNTDYQLNITTLNGTPNVSDGGGCSINIGSNIKGTPSNTNYGGIRIGSDINTSNIYSLGVMIAPKGIESASGIIMSSNVATIKGNTGRKTGGIMLVGNGNAEIGPNKGACSILIGSHILPSTKTAINANNTTVINNGYNNNITITEDNTFWWGNENAMYKIFDSDGTIPKERLTNVVTTPSTMPELTVAGWSNNTQTVTVTGVTATNTVFVSPAPASASDYASAGIICTAQGTDSLTFTCTTVPTNAITVNVVIM